MIYLILKQIMKKMHSGWIRRRWLDFRFGHSVYLIFVLTFSNFVLIFHRLLIERVEFLDQIFSELWVFILFFVGAYVPLSIGIGVWHRRTQISVESEQTLLNNPFMARNFRMMIDVFEGKASKEEIKKYRDLLVNIEKKSELKFSK
jgi:hypothetical protein